MIHDCGLLRRLTHITCRCRASHSIKTSFTHSTPHLQVYYLRVFGCVVTDRYHYATERERWHCVPHYRAPHSTLPLLPSLLSSPISTHPWACLIRELFFSLTMLPSVCAVTRKPLRQKDGSRQAQDALDITSGIHRRKDKSFIWIVLRFLSTLLNFVQFLYFMYVLA